MTLGVSVRDDRVPIVDPMCVLEAFGDREDLFFFDRPNRRESVVGVGAAFTIEANGRSCFQEARERGAAHFRMITDRRVRFYGGFSFDGAECRFVAPRWLYRIDRHGASLSCIGEPARSEVAEWERALARPPPVQPNPRAVAVADLDPYEKMVGAALELIEADELQKIVLRRRFSVLAEADYRMSSLLAVLDDPRTMAKAVFGFQPGGRRLDQDPAASGFQPGGRRFRRSELRPGQQHPLDGTFDQDPAVRRLQAGASFFAGATPELLIARAGTEIRSEALAGSARAPDELFSEKNLSEHRFVVDAIRSTFEGFSSRVIVSGPQSIGVPFLSHLRTTVVGSLHGGAHILEIAERLHPTPAVGGVPRCEALRAIHAIEGRDRGWYAAPVGWFDRSGDGELFVAIRSASFSGSRAEIYAGSGIVRGSTPEAESAETRAKARTIATVLGVAP